MVSRHGHLGIAIRAVAGAALLLVMTNATAADAGERQPSLAGPLTIDAAVDVRPRRCIQFLVPDRGILRECPVALLGTGRLFLRPTGPLLIHARVAAGGRHIRNSALIHSLADPGEAVGAIPLDMFVLDADVGVGVWSFKELFEVSAWAGPSLLFEQVSKSTQAAASSAGLESVSVGNLFLGARIQGQLDLVVEDALRIGFRVGLDVVGTAAFVWTPDSSESDREALQRLNRGTEVRTLLSMAVAAPPEGPVALVGDIGVATGWALLGPQSRAAWEELGVELPAWFHIWPEFRLLVGVRVRPPER